MTDVSDTLRVVREPGGLVLGEDVKVEELTTDVDTQVTHALSCRLRVV